MQRHLIIKSLHRDESFLAGAANLLEENLRNLGECVVVRDLYAMNFNPVLTSSDFELMKENKLPEDIKREQKYINDADYIWVIFPIWWTSMPAILKGYIDRVFLSGFAYTMKNDAPVGKLQPKKVILANSMGQSFAEYEELGMFNALKLTIDKGIFEFCGMTVIDHHYYSSIMSADAELKEKYLKKLIKSSEQIVNSKESNVISEDSLNEHL